MCTCSSRSAKGRADQGAALAATVFINVSLRRHGSTGLSSQDLLSYACGRTRRLSTQDAAQDSPTMVRAGDLPILHLALYSDVF